MVVKVNQIGHFAARLHEHVTFGIGCAARTQRVMKPLDLGWVTV